MSVQGQMGGGFIMKMLCPLYLFFSWGLSEAAQRQTGAVSSGKKAYQLHLYFFDAMGELGGSQGHIRGRFTGKKLCPWHLFFFEYWGD